MARVPKSFTVSIPDVFKNVTITVKYEKLFWPRVKLGLFLVKMAAIVLDCNLEFVRVEGTGED